MSVQQAVIVILLSVVASMISAGILWVFRRQVQDVLTRLDLSTDAVLGWLMAFIMLAVIIVFPLIVKEVPAAFLGTFVGLAFLLVGSTVWQRR